MMIERDQVLLDPLTNSPLKIWEVQNGSIEWLTERSGTEAVSHVHGGAGD
jgi:hypothetical protein